MLLAQISDLHIVRTGQLVSNSVDTAAHLERAVARLASFEPRPDAVVITGDLVDSGAVEEYQRLRALLAPLTMPIHLLVGNHDERASFRTVFGGEGEFIQYSVDVGEIRLIALDTLVPGEGGGTLCEKRLGWLAAELESPPTRAAQAVVIAMHHPPFASGIAFMDKATLDAGSTARLAAIVSRHPKIERVICGHVHRPIVARFAGTVASVVPSAAHQVSLLLDPEAHSAIDADPPAIGIHLWRPGTGLVSHTAYVEPSRTYSKWKE